MTIGEDLLETLACPKCKGPLQMTDDQSGLDCEKCKLRYPIEGDIPVMLSSEASPIE